MAKRVRVHGDVQGVFFRDSVRQEAERRGIAGWVRNCEDGTVEALFAGDEADALVDYCRTGPPRATVERVEVSDDDAQPDGFTVR